MSSFAKLIPPHLMLISINQKILSDVEKGISAVRVLIILIKIVEKLIARATKAGAIRSFPMFSREKVSPNRFSDFRLLLNTFSSTMIGAIAITTHKIPTLATKTIASATNGTTSAIVYIKLRRVFSNVSYIPVCFPDSLVSQMSF
ncbi:MAG: hypothetical protein LBO09_06950 [Candidatus Peribacteria bacterium]|jgi:hypothetical protein|nr:hypothetical protein [Candidatus Peribacteria bacterium]